MDFGEALRKIKSGAMVSRSGWNGKGMWIAMEAPCEGSAMTLPFIFMKTADDQKVPWLASQTDLLANDWSVLPQSGG